VRIIFRLFFFRYQDYKLVLDSLGFLSATDESAEKDEKHAEKDAEKNAKIDAEAAEKKKSAEKLSEVSGVHVRHIKSTAKVLGGFE
jgi:hypothetical protein